MTVEIENGRLQGLRENDAVSFRGIPYGADTGGRNRFMAPRPVANWAGVREAPEGYFETGRFEIPDKGLPSWSHPVISDGRLYVRNQDILKVYDIKAPATP